MKVYVASSWRNERQPGVVVALRIAGHNVYDFRHTGGVLDGGFRWSWIDLDWQEWDAAHFRAIVTSDEPFVVVGFGTDMDALNAADACVLVLPCGRSAHLELGYSVGLGKRTVVLLDERPEPELMYRMVDHLCLTVEEVEEVLK